MFSNEDTNDLILCRTSDEVASLEDGDSIEALNPLGEGRENFDSRRVLLTISKNTPSQEALYTTLVK